MTSNEVMAGAISKMIDARLPFVIRNRKGVVLEALCGLVKDGSSSKIERKVEYTSSRESSYETCMSMGENGWIPVKTDEEGNTYWYRLVEVRMETI